jgi:hypothetical protein
MPSSLPPVFARDLDRLRSLPVGQLVAAANQRMPIYGFMILDVRPGLLIVCRSGIELEVQQDGRIVPAIRRKVG